jgi:hypothetical protein
MDIILEDSLSIEDAAEPSAEELVLTCINCGAKMDQLKCKLVCECGYFASCSDYY